MINGGGRLLREEAVNGSGMRSEVTHRGDDDERGWPDLSREDSVREGELRFREPAGSFRARPPGEHEGRNGGWR